MPVDFMCGPLTLNMNTFTVQFATDRCGKSLEKRNGPHAGSPESIL